MNGGLTEDYVVHVKGSWDRRSAARAVIKCPRCEVKSFVLSKHPYCFNCNLDTLESLIPIGEDEFEGEEDYE